MPFSSVVQAEAVTMLRRVLSAHCDKFGVLSDQDRTSIALSLLARYQNGLADEAELARLTEPKDRFSAQADDMISIDSRWRSAQTVKSAPDLTGTGFK